MPATREPTTDLLPARMLNEFVYCPRLFYYEHVEGVFVHNADTRRGAEGHKRVDRGKGSLPKAKKKKAGAVDAGDNTGDPADATSENETIHSRSVMLGSEALGVVAKLDLVEVTIEPSAADDDATSPGPLFARQVCPVEYKAGAPRNASSDAPIDLWDTDRMQLGLQILLLRENGYNCSEGVVFYRQTRQRVRYQLTDEEEAWIRATIQLARTCSSGPIPPPLDHSPKCPRCSLASVCLPDETHLFQQAPDFEASDEAQLGLPGLSLDEPGPTDSSALADALAIDGALVDELPEPRAPRPTAGKEVRRLIAPDADTKALYINTPGVSISKKGETVVVKQKSGTLAEIRIKDLHHLAVFGPTQLSTALVQTLCERDVPITYFSMGGWFYGLTRGHGLTNVFTRIEQFSRAADHDQRLQLARLFVYGKIRNQRTLLMRNHVEPPPITLRALKHASSAALAANSLPTLLGIEGAAALHYFKNFAGMIKAAEDDDDDDIPGLEEPPGEETRAIQQEFSFEFTNRNRRPPRDPVNALLSLAYSLLSRDCTIAACAVGFDPYVGFYHQPRFGRPALALDVMEEFRPIVADSVVLTVINNRMLGATDFVQAGDAVNLTPAGRKRFFLAYEKRMSATITHPVFDYKVSYRRALELQFRLLARTLTGEIESYVPFMTR